MGEYTRRMLGGFSIFIILLFALVAAGRTFPVQLREDVRRPIFAASTSTANAPSASARESALGEAPSTHHEHDPLAAAVTTAEATSTIAVHSSETSSPVESSTSVVPTSGPTNTAAVTLAPPSTTNPTGSTIAGDVSITNPIVAAGARLVFDPSSNATLRVRGNLTVLGSLVMHPDSNVVHRILFEDRGELLVTAGGVLDLQGEPKVAWNRTGNDPSWRASDELIVTAIAPGDWAYRQFQLGSSVPTYQGYSAEIANLTRNVVIDGPSRVMLMGLDGHAPQVIRYVTISNAGVRDQTGMYALHFHLNGSATRGSLVEGVVIRDSRFRAFVPHGSDGITFRDTLAVNVVANGYWWDLNRSSGGENNESHGILYERAGVIGLTTSDPPDQGRQAGFNLGDGTGNVIRESFATGLTSGPNHSGFQWPESARGVWTAQNLVSHNNKGHGFFVWQNNGREHLIQGVDAYLNGGAGISNGAYSNSYRWIDANLVGNQTGLHLHTLSKVPPSARQTFECLTITDSPVGVVVDASPANDGMATLFSRSVIQRVGQEFAVTEQALAQGQTIETRVELVAYQSGC